VAEKAVNLIVKKLQKLAEPCKTHELPLWGGDIEYLDEFKQTAIQAHAEELGEEVVLHLIHTYGSQYKRILAYLAENPAWAETIPNSNILQAEVIYAVREEMAEKLVDVILRRTDLASLEYPGEEALRVCANLMAQELGWNEPRIFAEIQDVENFYIVIPADKKPRLTRV
jgi:glycerol-3-phosphate dehydrogenase